MASGDSMALTLKMTYLRQVNWSLLRAGIPLVWNLEVTNKGSEPAEGLTVQFSLLHFLTPLRVPLPEIAPKKTQSVDLTGLSWQWNFGAAFELTHAVGTTLKVIVGDQVAECPIELLTPDEWCAGVAWNKRQGFVLDSTVELAEATFDLPPGGAVRPKRVKKAWTGCPPLQAATAALVLPEHPQVVELKNGRVIEGLSIFGGPHVSLDEWVSGDAEKRTQVVQAAFNALAQLHHQMYHDIERFSLQAWSQRIRFPDEVVSLADSRRRGATCVDYALLMCALLEACGLSPLFILVGTGKAICHALVGAWLKDVNDKPLLLTDVKAIQDHVSKEELLVVDVTEAAKGKAFCDACDQAKRFLFPRQFLYALDMQSTREDS